MVLPCNPCCPPCPLGVLPWAGTLRTPVSDPWDPGFHTSLSVHAANRRRLRRKPLSTKNVLWFSLIKLKSLQKLSPQLFPHRWWQQSREQDPEWLQPSCQWRFIPEPHENVHCGCCSRFCLSRSPLLLSKLTWPLLEHPNTFGRKREVWPPNTHSLWLPCKVHG